MLNYTRALIALRRSFIALRRGQFLPLTANRHILAYLRQDGAESILIAMNFSDRSQPLSLPADVHLQNLLLVSTGEPPRSQKGQQIFLHPQQAVLWQVRAPISNSNGT
ncbi:MAG: alpha-glucosidase C-terminal domain-containing protein [Anaerolineales bacterium]|nr:alpha-glucosidase C-terminal domain-containing protein [Anaerolineales bacterium]